MNGDTLKHLYATLNSNFSRLSQRERIMVMGVGALIALVFFLLIVMSINKQSHALNAATALKTKQLTKVYELSSKIQTIEKVNHGNASRDFKLFSFLEDLANRQHIKERIEYMKPVTGAVNEQEMVEVRIKGIFEQEMIGFLYGIENCPTPLSVKRLNIKRNDKDKNIDIIFQVQVHA